MSRFGFSTEPSAGGDFLPIVKYDARAGRMFRVDRTADSSGSFSSTPVDITDSFKAIADFENIETGWIDFATGGAPDFKLVPMGSPLPVKPTDKHKNGIRFMLKLAKDCGGEKPIRELAGVAKVFLNGIEKVYEEYEVGKAANAGKLPVITLAGSTPIKSGSGDKTSTNYMPKFKIAAWAPRGDLVFTPKGSAPAQQSSAQPSRTPPDTGSTRVEAPAAKAPEMADADDFG